MNKFYAWFQRIRRMPFREYRLRKMEENILLLCEELQEGAMDAKAARVRLQGLIKEAKRRYPK